MTSIAPQLHDKTVDEVRLLSVDFGSSASGEENRTGKLSSGELLTGTVTVVTQTKSPTTSEDLTYASKAVNTSTVTIDGRDAIAGEAAQFTATGGINGTTYVISVKAATDTSTAQTLEGFVTLKVTEPA